MPFPFSFIYDMKFTNKSVTDLMKNLNAHWQSHFVKSQKLWIPIIIFAQEPVENQKLNLYSYIEETFTLYFTLCRFLIPNLNYYYNKVQNDYETLISILSDKTAENVEKVSNILKVIKFLILKLQFFDDFGPDSIWYT